VTELLPCPFCAGETETVEQGDNSPHWVVGCAKCDAVMDVNYRTEADAIEAWNRRAQPPVPVEAIRKAAQTRIDALLKEAKSLHEADMAEIRPYLTEMYTVIGWLDSQPPE
jgi:Lar family restriction alleviation protein